MTSNQDAIHATATQSSNESHPPAELILDINQSSAQFTPSDLSSVGAHHAASISSETPSATGLLVSFLCPSGTP